MGPHLEEATQEHGRQRQPGSQLQQLNRVAVLRRVEPAFAVLSDPLRLEIERRLHRFGLARNRVRERLHEAGVEVHRLQMGVRAGLEVRGDERLDAIEWEQLDDQPLER